MNFVPILENGVVVGQRYSNGAVLYHLKNFVCFFDGTECSRSGWCIRQSKKHNVDGSRLRLMDVCPRYSTDERQMRF